MSASEFGKRVFTASAYVAQVRDVAAHMADLQAAAHERRVSRAFAEKIMLAVTQVNGCRYCSYAHTHAALAAGVAADELRRLMVGEFDGAPEQELVALLFAQHYAEQGGQPAPDAWQRVLDCYGPAAARDILAYIRMITLGNMLGNTFDALLYRLSLHPMPGSRFRDEVAILVLTAFWVPTVFVRAALARRWWGRSQPVPAPSA